MPDVPPEFLRQYLLGNRQGKSVLNDVLPPRSRLLGNQSHSITSQVELPGARRDPTPELMAAVREMASRVAVTRSFPNKIVADPYMVETVEDWSAVRSPSRASRRRRQGHPQRIRYVERPMREVRVIGDKMFIHPSLADHLRGTVQKSLNKRLDQAVLEVLSWPQPTTAENTDGR